MDLKHSEDYPSFKIFVLKQTDEFCNLNIWPQFCVNYFNNPQNQRQRAERIKL